MAGFVLKELVNTNIVGTAVLQNVNLFTVPVGHTYMVKRGHLRIIRTAAGADTFNIERSDTAGTNFRNAVDPISTPAAAATAWFNLTPLTTTLQNTGAVVAEGGNAQYASMENMIFEAGTILRIVIPAGFTSGDNIQVALDGVDNTL
jgi:hypothetical protein